MTRTWHHGLVARWWAEFNEGGEDVEYFRRAVKRFGEPVLDAGCGTGRLLLPFLNEGMNIDGCDASGDMLEWCRKGADSEGLSVKLYRQPMHELDLPRRYRTIVVCGAFGLGGARADDLEGLRRIRAHLEPGGALIMDHYLPNFDAQRWKAWVEKPKLPRSWPERGDRRRAGDGSELELWTRQIAFDPLEQTTSHEIRVCHYVDGEEVASEIHTIDIGIYFKREIELMLVSAGFRDIRTTGSLEERSARPWEDRRLVFEARA